MKQWFIRAFKVHVYVVVALEYEKVKECKVFLSSKRAWLYREELIAIYGGANVCLASRLLLA